MTKIENKEIIYTVVPNGQGGVTINCETLTVKELINSLVQHLGMSKVQEYEQIINSFNLGIPANRSLWSFKDWSKNDPDGLLDLKNNHPVAFQMLINTLPKQLSDQYNPFTDLR